MKTHKKHVAIIGAGPVGIAAAAHLLAQGQAVTVFEKSPTAGGAMLEWGHVGLFSPWKYTTDKAVVELLKKMGWAQPNPEALPTGRDIALQYLVPAANTPELRDVIQYNTEVLAISKDRHSKHTSTERDEADFVIHYKNEQGSHSLHAQAVIDASGTWSSPNPIGLDGLPVPGETENKASIAYGIPDVAGTLTDEYAGKKTLVIGAGHSAINIALDLLKLQQVSPETYIVWGLRKNNIEKLLGGGINDELLARGELGMAAKKAIDTGALDVFTDMQVKRIAQAGGSLGVTLLIDGEETIVQVDKIIVATGFRPDLQMLREVRLNIDHIVEAPSALAPLIDPNHHSCGTVKPHGVEELSHHDKGFYIVGMKSYGRAPTFLMLTGYEQVRSIAAEIAGDHEAARQVELELPQTGVCSSSNAGKKQVSACGTTVKQESTSCCAPTATPEVTPSASSCCAPIEPKGGSACC